MSHSFGTTFTFVPETSTNVTRLEPTPNTLEELFRIADWPAASAEQDLAGNSNLFSCSPFPFEVSSSHDLSEEAFKKIAKSREDFQRLIAARNDFNEKLTELSKTESKAEPENDTKASDKMEIPKSYEDIYQVSVRNRQKNKDKKRTRESDSTNVSSEIASGVFSETAEASAESAGDFDYFALVDKKVNTDVQSTLDFVQEIGWIKDAAQRAEIEDTHNRDLAANGEGASESGPGGDVNNDLRSSNNNPLRRSNDKKLKASQGDRPMPKSFDYSKVAQGPIGAGSAQSLRQSGDGKLGGGEPDRPKINSKQANKLQPFRVKSENMNPYLFGAGMDDK